MQNVAQRIRQLQNDARALADGHISAWLNKMHDCAATAKEICEGGDAYPASIQDAAKTAFINMEREINIVEGVLARLRQNPVKVNAR